MQGFKQYFKEEWDRVVQSDLDLLRFNLYKNPDAEELNDVLEEDRKFVLRYYDPNDADIVAAASGTARGVLCDKGDVYIWAQNPMEHKTMAKRIPINANVGFYIYQKRPNEIKISSWSSNKELEGRFGGKTRLSNIWIELIKNSPNIKKMFGAITPSVSVDQDV